MTQYPISVNTPTAISIVLLLTLAVFIPLLLLSGTSEPPHISDILEIPQNEDGYTLCSLELPTGITQDFQNHTLQPVLDAAKSCDIIVIFGIETSSSLIPQTICDDLDGYMCAKSSLKGVSMTSLSRNIIAHRIGSMIDLVESPNQIYTQSPTTYTILFNDSILLITTLQHTAESPQIIAKEHSYLTQTSTNGTQITFESGYPIQTSYNLPILSSDTQDISYGQKHIILRLANIPKDNL